MNDDSNGDDTVVSMDRKLAGEQSPPALPMLIADNSGREATLALRKKYARQMRLQALTLEQWCENAEQQISENRNSIAELKRMAALIETL